MKYRNQANFNEKEVNVSFALYRLCSQNNLKESTLIHKGVFKNSQKVASVNGVVVNRKTIKKNCWLVVLEINDIIMITFSNRFF